MEEEKPKKRQIACDSCHRGKRKCLGEAPCRRCVGLGRQCTFSEHCRLGRPKGSKNKRTLERCRAQEQSGTGHDRRGGSKDRPDVQKTVQLDNNQKSTFKRARRDGSTKGTITPRYAPQHPQDVLGHVSMSSPKATDFSGNSTTADTCECLAKQVQLLFRMDEVEKSQRKSSPDVSLVAARDAMEQWESLSQCQACRKSGTEGVFLMFVMSMRFLLRALRCSFVNAAAAATLDPTTTQQQYQQQYLASTQDAATATYTSNWHVSIGNYEATGEEYKITSRMLVVLAVQRIETALAYAKTRLQHRQAAAGLETQENEGRAAASASFDRLVPGDQCALLTENGFDNRIEMLLHGLEGLIGSGS